MKRIICKISIISLFITLLPAASIAETASGSLRTSGAIGEKSYQWDNGNTWNLLGTTESKTYYLIGLENGITLQHREIYYRTKVDKVKTESKDVRDILTDSSVKLSDLILLIDAFYKTAANLTIPIADAYLCTLMMAKGADESQLTAYIIKLREIYK